jgi:hypothetical protein
LPTRALWQYQRKNYFYFYNTGKSADFPVLFFHEKGSNREMMCRPSPLEKLALWESRRSERCD